MAEDIPGFDISANMIHGIIKTFDILCINHIHVITAFLEKFKNPASKIPPNI
jgi:hypothetical protein